MPTLIDSDALDMGDVVLNFGDTIYSNRPAREMAHDHVLRLAAYLLFAGRVGMPTRHLVQNEALFTLVKWMPELLQEGLVFGDVPKGVPSVLANVTSAPYRTIEAEGRAAYLDEHSKIVHEFDATGMMAAFHQQFARDVGEAGPLARLLERDFSEGRQTVANLREKLARLQPARHDAFLEAVRSCAHRETHDTLTRWAAVRYYTTPMDFDYCVRDIPYEASALMLRAEASLSPHVQDPDVAATAPEPMRSAVEVMELGFPITYEEADARCLIEAVLKTRQDVPEARAKFSSVVSVAFEKDFAGEINGLLRRNLAQERLLKMGSPSLSEAFRVAASEGTTVLGTDKLIGALDIAAAWLAPAIGGIRGSLMSVREHREMRKRAPWKVTCEYLHRAYEGTRSAGLRALLRGGGQ